MVMVIVMCVRACICHVSVATSLQVESTTPTGLVCISRSALSSIVPCGRLGRGWWLAGRDGNSHFVGKLGAVLMKTEYWRESFPEKPLMVSQVVGCCDSSLAALARCIICAKLQVARGFGEFGFLCFAKFYIEEVWRRRAATMVSWPQVF